MSQVIVVESIGNDGNPWCGAKGDLVLAALSELGINGMAAPVSSEKVDALTMLETMMYDFEGRSMCVGYNFEEEPDTASNHGIPRRHKYAIQTNLAVRMASGLEIQVNPSLDRQASQSLESLSARTINVRQVQHSSRMPRGSGSRYNTRYRRYFTDPARPSINCSSVALQEGETKTITLSFQDELKNGDRLQSVIGEATPLISVTFTAADFAVTYVVTGSQQDNLQRIKFIATTEQGNTLVKIVDVSISGSDIDGGVI